MNIIVGIRNLDNDLRLFVDGEQLDPRPSQKLYNHSPSGFHAGYGGSGPAQSALAIMLHVAGKEKALKHYQSFKWEFLCRPEYMDAGFTFEVDIKLWIIERTILNSLD